MGLCKVSCTEWARVGRYVLVPESSAARAWRRAPVRASQSVIVPPTLDDAMYLPSGEKATDPLVSVLSSIVRIHELHESWAPLSSLAVFEVFVKYCR